MPLRDAGTVKWFNAEKRYGFIARTDKPDIFVHASGISTSALSKLRPGQQVIFDVKDGLKGPIAVNVVEGDESTTSSTPPILESKPLQPSPTIPLPNVETPRVNPTKHFDPSRHHVRINELARHLGVKAHVLLSVLPELGVTEKKTHSSSLRRPVADKVRVHFGEIILEDDELPESSLELIHDFQRLIDELISSRADLFELSPRQFEELVAEIWNRFGFDVELTKRTRDGGYDVLAIKQQREVDLKFLIECKRYAPDNKVGVSIVRSLFGVREHEGATKAVLATTSYFTQGALRFFKDHRWQLEGRDHDGVLDWAKQASKLSRKPGDLLWSPDCNLSIP